MTSKEVSVEGYESLEEGEQTLTVRYKGKTATFTVTVKNDITGIRIKTEPTKKTYVKGEELDLTGGTITVTYEDGSTEEIDMTSKEVSVEGYESLEEGEQTLTVRYKGKTATFTVTVKNDITGIRIKTEPTKRTYVKGEELDLTGGTITVTYEDGSTKEILMTSEEVIVEGYDANLLGEQTLTITYQGKIVKLKINIVEKQEINSNDKEEKEQESTGEQNEITMLPKILPYTGLKIKILVLIIVIIFAVVSYIKYRKYKKIC